MIEFVNDMSYREKTSISHVLYDHHAEAEFFSRFFGKSTEVESNQSTKKSIKFMASTS